MSKNFLFLFFFSSSLFFFPLFYFLVRHWFIFINFVFYFFIKSTFFFFFFLFSKLVFLLLLGLTNRISIIWISFEENKKLYYLEVRVIKSCCLIKFDDPMITTTKRLVFGNLWHTCVRFFFIFFCNSNSFDLIRNINKNKKFHSFLLFTLFCILFFFLDKSKNWKF